MADRFYQSGLASGANDGTSWADAWQTLQAVLDNHVAGDHIFLDTVTNGAEVLSATADDDTVNGTASGNTQFFAVNGDQSATPEDDVDGTMAVFDANSAATFCVQSNGFDYRHWKNCEFKNATSHGFDIVATAINCCWEGCSFNNNNGHGMDMSVNADGNVFVQCRFDNNGGSGHQGIDDGHLILCQFINNSAHGCIQLAAAGHSTAVLCLAHNNTTDGFVIDEEDFVILCTSDGNGRSGIGNFGTVNNAASFLNRLTNNTGYGIGGFGSSRMCIGMNAFRNNTGGESTGSASLIDIGQNVTLTADGYEDIGSDNFSLNDSSEARRDSFNIGFSQ